MYNSSMTLLEINNMIKKYKSIVEACKKNKLNYAGAFYEGKLRILEAERKEILKNKENT